MYNFFAPDEKELEQVIRETLKGHDELVQAKTIQTGWTNITMDVKGEKDNYIFRFPRNLFFAKMMIKDCQFCQFIHDKVHTPTPDMKLKFHKERPYSVHKKIKGSSLTSKMDHLSSQEIEKVCTDLADFLTELHALPAQSMPAEIEESLDNFLTGLASVHKGNYDLSKHDRLKNMEKNVSVPSIIHGDFNPGNVLLDEDNHVSGIIDFSFASISDKHADIGRFVGRSSPEWGETLIQAYQIKTKTPCQKDKIQDIVDLFKYVEFKYVQYMQSNHPEIVIPEFVLQMAANEAKNFEPQK